MTAAVPEPGEARRAVEAARATGDRAQLAGAEMYLGASLFEHHQPVDALETFQTAEQTYAAAGMRREADLARLNQARCLSALDRDAEAVALYEAVGHDHRRTDLQVAYAAWSGLLEHLDQRGEAARADELVSRLEGLAVAAGDERELAAFESWAGHALAQREGGEQRERGAHLLASAARRYEGVGEHGLAADALMFEGSTHHGGGGHHQAVDCYTRAVAAYERAGDQQGAANARHNLEVVSSG